MNARSSFLLPAVVASLAAAFARPAPADEADERRSRADVRAEVLQARAAGHLMRAGEGFFAPQPGRGTTDRAEVKAAVLQALARGELMAAGDRPTAVAMPISTRVRAEVKDEVKQAQAAGELVPAGERIAAFEPASHPARAYRDRGHMSASARR
jgi:hypothetical protein